DDWAPLKAKFAYNPQTGLLAAVDRGLGSVVQVAPASDLALLQPAAGSAAGRAVVQTAYQPTQPGQPPLMHTSVETLDERGRLLKVERPLHNSEEWQRDEHGRVRVYIDPMGRRTRYTYDYSHNTDDLTEVDYADGTSREYDY